MAQSKTYSTRELSGTRVVGGKKGDSRIGKVDRFVFHPSSKRCVGFLVKRPDLALMFHRKDLFVPLDGFHIEDGRVALPYKDKEMEGRGAIERLGLDWDACVLWEGMPIVTEGGTTCGVVEDIVFSRTSGKVVSISVGRGATERALLGEKVVPASMICGFKIGIGAELTTADMEETGDEPLRGAILVSDEVLEVQSEGGIAEAAGQQVAIAQDKVRKTVAKTKPKASEAAKAAGNAMGKGAQAAGKAMSKGTQAAGQAVNKGAYATGRQLRRAQGMFAAFKDEYDKAVSDDSRKAAQKK